MRRRPDARRLAAGLADAGPGLGARAGRARAGSTLSTPSAGGAANAEALERVAAGRGAAAVRGARAVRLAAGSPTRWRGPASGCSWSTRRTASRSGATTSAPTTSPSPTPPGGVGARATIGADRDRDAAVSPTTSSRRLRAARSGPRDDRLRPAQPELRRRPRAGTAVDKRRRLAAALAEPDALPAIVYAGTRATSARSWPASCRRALGEEVLAYHAGLDRERARRGPGAVHVRRGAGDRRDQRVRDGDRQGRRADRLPRHRARARSRPTTRRPAGPGGTARPARCLLFAEQRDKGLHVFFIQRARLDAGAFERVARAAAMGRARRALRRRGCPSSRPTSGPAATTTTVRAVIGHLARAGVGRAGAGAARPRRGPDRRRVGSPRAGAHAWARPATPSAPAGASTARSGSYVEGVQLPARGAAGALRRPVGGDADGRLLRRLRRRAGGPRPAGRRWQAGPASVGRAPRRPRRRDPRRGRPGAPPVGRTRAVEILRGGRSKVDRPERLRRPRRTTARSPICARARCSGGSIELLEAGTLRSTGGRFPKLRAA